MEARGGKREKGEGMTLALFPIGRSENSRKLVALYTSINIMSTKRGNRAIYGSA